jgi:hypothetical protein
LSNRPDGLNNPSYTFGNSYKFSYQKTSAIWLARLMDKNHIISEIQKTAAANGGVPLGRRRFRAETGVRDTVWWGKHWARWGDALKEAGFAPNTLQRAYDEELLLKKLASLARDTSISRSLPTW